MLNIPHTGLLIYHKYRFWAFMCWSDWSGGGFEPCEFGVCLGDVATEFYGMSIVSLITLVNYQIVMK